MKLLGAGGHALVVAEIAANNGFTDIAMLGIEECDRQVDGVSVPSSVEGPVFIAVGNNDRRRRIARNLNADYPILIGKTAYVSDSAKIGKGTIVMPQAAVQPGTKIGEHCIINTGAVVDHTCTLGDFVHISPNATLCGDVVVGEGAWVGAGATVLPGRKIGKDAVVGAGSVILHNVPEGKTVVGIF